MRLKLVCLDKDCCPIIRTDHNGKEFEVGERIFYQDKEMVIWNG